MPDTWTRSILEDYLRADLWYTSGTDCLPKLLRLTRPGLYYQRVLRRAEYWEAQPDGPVRTAMLTVHKLWLLRLTEKIGIEIPRHVFGPGLSIAHPFAIVVNGDVRVGARCRLSQGVTLGAGREGAPTIGSDVFFGPNSQAIGPIRIGDGVTVLPGAVVTHDVEDGCAVGGVPARVINIGTPPWHQSMKPTPPYPGKLPTT